MDAFTHVITGAVIAKAVFEPTLGHWGLITGAVVGLLPDIDFLLKFINKNLYIKYHRSITNSIFFVLPFALLWGYLFNRLSGLHLITSFTSLSLVVLLSHIFLDTLNPFGTMIFTPFSDYRLSLDIAYLVDLPLTSIVLFPLLASSALPDHSQFLARLSLTLLVFYILFRFHSHFLADWYNRQFIQAHNLVTTNYASLPTHRSPFHWNNIIETDEWIYKAGFNIFHQQNLDDLYKCWPKYSHCGTDEKSTWIQRALELPEVKTYLWFARFPVMRYQGLVQDTHRVAFYDYRFDGYKGKLPFVYIVDFSPDGQVSDQHFHKNWDFSSLLKEKWIDASMIGKRAENALLKSKK